MKRILLTLLTLMVMAGPALALEDLWADVDFNNRIFGTIDTVDVVDTHTNFPVEVYLVPADSVVFNRCQSDGADILFTLNDGVTVVPHKVVSWDATADSAQIWVLMPTLSDTLAIGYEFYLYYGNPTAVGKSGEAVWPVADYAVVHTFDTVPSLQMAPDETAFANNSYKWIDGASPPWVDSNRVDASIGKGWEFLDTRGLRNDNITAADVDSSWAVSMIVDRLLGKDSYDVIFQWFPFWQHVTAATPSSWQQPAFIPQGYPGITRFTLAAADTVQQDTPTWVVFQSEADTVRYFINGVEKTWTVAQAFPSGSATTGGKIIPYFHQPLGIGTTSWYDDTSPEGFDGTLDQFEFHHKSRSTAWWLTKYNMESDNANFFSFAAAQLDTIVKVNSIAGDATHTSEMTISGVNMGAFTLEVDFMGFQIEAATLGVAPESIDSNWTNPETGAEDGQETITNEFAWSGHQGIKFDSRTGLAHASGLMWKSSVADNWGDRGIYVSYWWKHTVPLRTKAASPGGNNLKVIGFSNDFNCNGAGPLHSQFNSVVVGQQWLNTGGVGEPLVRGSWKWQGYANKSCSGVGCYGHPSCYKLRTLMWDSELVRAIYTTGYTLPDYLDHWALERLNVGGTESNAVYGPNLSGDWERHEWWFKQGARDAWDGEAFFAKYVPDDDRYIGVHQFGNNFLNGHGDVDCECDGSYEWDDVIMYLYNTEAAHAGVYYTDDYYYSVGTPARVEVCDNATWGSTTVCEIQEVTSWTNSTIKFFLNTGRFGSTDADYVEGRLIEDYTINSTEAWAFVIGPDNEPLDTSGLSITMTGSGPGRRGAKWPVPTISP